MVLVCASYGDSSVRAYNNICRNIPEDNIARGDAMTVRIKSEPFTLVCIACGARMSGRMSWDFPDGKEELTEIAEPATLHNKIDNRYIGPEETVFTVCEDCEADGSMESIEATFHNLIAREYLGEVEPIFN